MRTQGLKIPIMVQPREDVSSLSVDYEFRIVAGHRRYTAAKYLLHWETIPATVMSGLSEADARFLNLLENLERKNLTLIQEARALRASFPPGTKFEQMAVSLNKSSSWCRLRWRILDLPDEVLKLVEQNVLGVSDLQLLLYKNGKEQLVLATEIQIAKLQGFSTRRYARRRGCRVARTRKVIDEMLTNLMAEGHYPDPYRALAWAAGHLTDEEFLESGSSAQDLH